MNPVFSLLNNSRGKKLGVKRMSKTLGLSKKTVIYYCHKDSRIRRVNGLEIGSGKHKPAVFTLDP